MKRHLHVTSWWATCCLLGLAAPGAMAWPLKLAVHPAVVPEGDEAETELLRAVIDQEWAGLPVERVDPAEVKRQLAAEGCDRADEQEQCLASLARATGAHAAALVSISRRGSRLYLFGNVVRRDGVVAVSAQKEHEHRPGRSDVMRDVVKSFIRKELRLEEDLASMLATGSEVTPSKPPATGERRWSRAGLALTGAGALALAGGAAFSWSAMASWRELNALAVDSASLSPEEVARGRAIKARGEGQQLAGGILLAAGAAAALGGGYWLLWGGGEQETVVLSVGPSGIAASGSFP